MANFNKFTSSGAELTGNARPEDVAQGKEFYSNDEDTKLVGTLPVRGESEASGITIYENNLFLQKIPEGIYKYQGGINQPEIHMPADCLGNTTPEFVLEGQTFTSKNGIKQTGAMANQGDWSFTLAPGESKTLYTGFYSGRGKATARQVKLKQLGVVSLYGAGLGNTPTQHKSATFNVANVYSRYRDLTTNDFPIPLKSCSAGTAEQFGNCGITSMSYNPSNGILTINYDASSYFNSAGADIYIYVLDRYEL